MNKLLKTGQAQIKQVALNLEAQLSKEAIERAICCFGHDWEDSLEYIPGSGGEFVLKETDFIIFTRPSRTGFCMKHKNFDTNGHYATIIDTNDFAATLGLARAYDGLSKKLQILNS